MKKNKYIIATLVCASFTVGLSAKDTLSKEVVVEKDYVPTENKVSKPNTTPKVETIDLPNSDLQFSNWVMPTSTGNTIPVMSPYGYQTSKNFTTNRGYLDLGLGNNWNIVGSAGYKIIDTKTTTLGAWLQHNSTWGYKNYMAPSEELQNFKIKHIDDVVGLNFSHYLGTKQIVADGYYHFGRLNYMGSVSPFNNVNEGDLRVKFLNEEPAEALNYHVGAHFNYFGNGFRGDRSEWSVVKENYYQLLGGVSMEFGDQNRAGIDFNGEMIHRVYPGFIETPSTGGVIKKLQDQSLNSGLLHFSPYYKKSSHDVNVRLGVNVDLSIKDGGAFHIAPDVNVGLKMIDGFGVEVSATGGKTMNRVSQFYAMNRYITPFEPLANSFTPLDAKAGFNVGPFAGFKAKAWIGWGRTNDFQEMRYMGLDNTTNEMAQLYPLLSIGYISQDVRGWYFGGEMSYSFRDVATLSINGQYANQKNETGYAGMGADRAKYIINAELQVKPIKKLTLGVGYELRGGRKVWDTVYPNLPVSTDGIPLWVGYELKNVNNLKFNAHYQITDMIGAFVNVENLLGKKWEYVQNYAAQKFNAMGGVTLKF